MAKNLSKSNILSVRTFTPAEGRSDSFKLPLPILEMIDLMVKSGIWLNKAEIYREALRDLFAKHYDFILYRKERANEEEDFTP